MLTLTSAQSALLRRRRLCRFLDRRLGEGHCFRSALPTIFPEPSHIPPHRTLPLPRRQWVTGWWCAQGVECVREKEFGRLIFK